ncbi:Scn11a [Symbiodinium sp. CCMP2456]|nr:Scn11a [Symbiodinium sp. CCMP2456]
MTGVFCNSAIKAAESDHEMVVQSLVQTRQEKLYKHCLLNSCCCWFTFNTVVKGMNPWRRETWCRVCHECAFNSVIGEELKDQVATLFYQILGCCLARRIDERGQGQITFTDFEKLFEDDAVKAFFESLQIGAVDAWTLFQSLDMDGDHTISVDEFTERCLQLHGPARSADLYALRQSSAKLGKQLQAIERAQQRLDFQLLRAGSALSTSVGETSTETGDELSQDRKSFRV